MNYDALLKESPDPDIGEDRLQRLLEDSTARRHLDKLPDEDVPCFLNLITISNFIYRYLCRHPEIIATLYGAQTLDISELDSITDLDSLRHFKYKELIKISWLDICQRFSYQIVLDRLSLLAEYIINKTMELVVEDDWNAKQCELATGSGGLYGKGFGKGTQNPLGFLPKKITPTDFIFSVISEETGFIGSAFLLSCYALMILLGLHISAKSGDDFGKYLAAGIATVFCIHIFINIGMTIRVVPIIGIPLPFVSYGGSGMIGMMACMGVLQSVYIHRHDH